MKSWRIPAWQRSLQELSCSLPQPSSAKPMNAPGGRIVRTIGIVRARAKIGLQNLAYNIRRLVTLERLAAA